MLPKYHRIRFREEFSLILSSKEGYRGRYFSGFFLLTNSTEVVDNDHKDYNRLVRKNLSSYTSSLEKRRLHETDNSTQEIVEKISHLSDNMKLGIIASKKVSKKAVVRNKIKRRMKYLFLKEKENLPSGVKLVLIANKNITGASYKLLLEDFKKITDSF